VILILLELFLLGIVCEVGFQAIDVLGVLLVNFKLAVDNSLLNLQEGGVIPPALNQVLFALSEVCFHYLSIQFLELVGQLDPELHFHDGLVKVLHREQDVVKQFSILGQEQPLVVLEDVNSTRLNEVVVNGSTRSQVVLVVAVDVASLFEDREEGAEEVVEVLSDGTVDQIVLVVKGLSVVLRFFFLNDIVVN